MANLCKRDVSLNGSSFFELVSEQNFCCGDNYILIIVLALICHRVGIPAISKVGGPKLFAGRGSECTQLVIIS